MNYQLHIDATDLDQHLTLYVAGSPTLTAFEPVCVVLSEILAVAKRRKDVDVSLASTADGFTIDSARLRTQPVADWPERTRLAVDGGTLALTNEDWLDYLDTVSHAASTEETRYYLNGVLIRALSGTEVAFVATDEYRLAALNVSRFNTLTRDVIVPNSAIKTMRLLFKQADKKEKTVLEFVGSNALRIETGSFSYFAKAVDGTYPDYARVISKTDADATHLNIRTETLGDAV